MIISLITEKVFGENPTCLHGKSPREYRTVGIYRNLRRAMHERPTATIIPNGENWSERYRDQH